MIFIRLFQYVENVPKWGEQCEISAANVCAVGSGKSDSTRSAQPNASENSQQDINTLESTIHLHQSLYESMCQVRRWLRKPRVIYVYIKDIFDSQYIQIIQNAMISHFRPILKSILRPKSYYISWITWYRYATVIPPQ